MIHFCFNRWKSPDNEFRTNPAFKLKEIPTIVDYGTVSELDVHTGNLQLLN